MARKARLRGGGQQAASAPTTPTQRRAGTQGADFAATEAYVAPERESQAARQGREMGIIYSGADSGTSLRRRRRR